MTIPTAYGQAELFVASPYALAQPVHPGPCRNYNVPTFWRVRHPWACGRTSFALAIRAAFDCPGQGL